MLRKTCCRVNRVIVTKLEVLSRTGKKEGHPALLEKLLFTTNTISKIKEMSHTHGIPLPAHRQVHFGFKTGILQAAAESSVHSRPRHHFVRRTKECDPNPASGQGPSSSEQRHEFPESLPLVCQSHAAPPDGQGHESNTGQAGETRGSEACVSHRG